MQNSVENGREKTVEQTYPYIHALGATATAKQAVRVNKDRKALMVFNNEAANIVELTSSKESRYGEGIPIAPQANYENEHYCQGQYFVICDTGLTADVRIEEDIIKR